MFLDGQGRQRLWHGINIVNKGVPFHPSLDVFAPGESVTDEDIKVLLSMGASVVRLGIMMGGMFPDGPVLNESYLEYSMRVVGKLHDNGIDTLIDLHQDVLSKKVCGEGTPDWMLNVSSLHAMPLPRPASYSTVEVDPATGYPKSCEPSGVLKSIGWSEWYTTDQCGKAFAQLYALNSPMSKAFEAYWRAVALKFKGHPGVIGYELLNEPWVGDHVGSPSLLLESGRAEQGLLKDYMQRMHDVIRAVDEEALILYAPAEINNRLMRRVGYERGFLPGAGMAYHVYCVVGTDGPGPTTPTQEKLCHYNDKSTMKQRQEDLARLGTAGFVTEFGAVNPVATGLAEMSFVLEHFESMEPPSSWAFWDFHEIQTRGTEEKATYIRTLARPYPRAIAGTLRSYTFDASSALFQMTFAPSSNGSMLTEVYLGKEHHYRSGFIVSMSPKGALIVQTTSFGVTLQSSGEGFGGQEVTVTVVPANMSSWSGAIFV